MERKIYDTFIIGHISLDEIIYNGETTKRPGGAVEAASYAAAAGGYKTGILTKTAAEDIRLLDIFNIPKEDIYHVVSKQTTSIRNEYLTADRERRNCTALGIADQFVLEDMPDVKSQIYHLAGLIAGDYNNELIKELKKKGKVAVDMQGFLRNAVNGQMIFKDWKEKKEYLPYIDFLKTDAAEAAVMTGCEDRYEAAKMLFYWGAKEVMVTHNTEVIVYDGKDFLVSSLKPRNLSGRTGRGDTCFSGYITERLNKGSKEAVLYAAALVSLKMETPGPFKGTREDVQ
ncbi:MAG: ribokinase, partial [Clostridiales bacterium]|nr:ribokinase [Clostridiales bacterium]